MRAIHVFFPALRYVPLLASAIGLITGLASCGRSPDAPHAVILHVGNAAEVQDLDPHMVSGITEHRTLCTLFEGLVNLNPSTLEPEPGVAAAWELAPDGLVYTFHLRPDARWSNGDPLTAEDFHYSWNRILSPNLAADYAYFLHCIKNAKPYNEGTLTDFGAVGVKVPDPHTLEVTLEHPTPYFLGMQTHQAYMPVHRATIERFGRRDERSTRWTRAGNHVGNGPYLLTEWTPNSVIRVRRNPCYWNREAVRLDGIDFYAIDNLWTQERAFRSGQLDMTDDVPLHKVRLYSERDPHRIVLHPYLGTYYYRINVTRPPFTDKRVRQAFAMALDREAITRNVTRGGEVPASCYTPPDTRGYTCRYQVPFDPEQARALLAEAGYPDGRGLPPIDILYNTSEAHKLIAEAVQQMWKEHLHADARLLNQDWKVYLDSTNTLNYSVARSGWIGDVVDPVNFLECFLSDCGNNRTGYASAEFDTLIHAAYAEADAPKRLELLQEAEAVLLDDAPLIPIYFYSRKYLKRPEVLGIEPNLLGYIRWTQVSLAGEPS
ncbi:MAG: peptide ABC transporter substrate-binding protein [Candidatus Hydrogenedentes bacterium]|nr:peptide ABC transporter substrate-binding protein [Candidatus Hydrogenedentota bacterium]